tara:strand:- start:2127 stop:2420 length:294 start_codon:yes stop_codon:yes gene_type:complete
MPKLVIDNDMNDTAGKMSDVFLITKQFKTSSDFSQYIEKCSKESGAGYIDALVDYCLKQEIEMESVKKLLTTSLKEKIKEEAESLNLLKEKSGKLPL